MNDIVKRGWPSSSLGGVKRQDAKSAKNEGGGAAGRGSSSVGGVKRQDAKDAKKAKNEGGAVWAGVQVRWAG